MKDGDVVKVTCRYLCIFGGQKQCAEYDPGTISTTTARKTHRDYPGDHFHDINVLPVKTASPSLRCFSPASRSNAGPAAFAIRVDHLMFRNFTYQNPFFEYYGIDSRSGAPALSVDGVYPISVPPGAPVHIKPSSLPPPPADRALYVRFGRHTTVMGIYDASLQTPKMKKEVRTLFHNYTGRTIVTE